MIRVRRQGWLAAIGVAGCTALAAAQPPAGPAAGAPAAAPLAAAGLEVTPHVSFGPDDASGVGASIGFRLRPRLVLELDAQARLANPERFQRVHANLSWDLRDGGRVTPFVIAGAGYDAYAGAYVIPSAGVFGWNSSGLAASVGGGVRVPIGDRWSLRADLRWSAGVSQGVPNRVRMTQGLAYRLSPR
jgi:hypothetical protein